MIKIEGTDVHGFEVAIRGMRNPKNSWDKIDSYYALLPPNDAPGVLTLPAFVLGPRDLNLAKTLANAGDDHGKFLRMITVSCDITAPLYWWKEMDTYKIGTVADSCSTMHKIADKEFTLDEYKGKIEAEWIPVDRRLPEENGNYLVVLDWGEPEVHEAVFYMYKDTPNWYDPVEEYEKYKFVTHWMPLPKLPGQLHSEEEKL